MRANKVVMVRPASFGFNEETAKDNEFQNQKAIDARNIALDEFDKAVEKLRTFDIEVLVLADQVQPVKPDAIFPNNWIQLRPDNTIALFPMFAKNRRLERQTKHIDLLKEAFDVQNIEDLTEFEENGTHLEGTGSLVFDHFNKVGYASISIRTDKSLAKEYITNLGYKPVIFSAKSSNNKDIYHTNVVMAIADKYAIICDEIIKEKNKVISHIAQNRSLILITEEQMNSFCGNCIELENQSGESILVMSKSAYNGFTGSQKQIIEQHSQICIIDIPIIESIGGGSARCMIAENFLLKK